MTKEPVKIVDHAPRSCQRGAMKRLAALCLVILAGCSSAPDASTEDQINAYCGQVTAFRLVTKSNADKAERQKATHELASVAPKEISEQWRKVVDSKGEDAAAFGAVDRFTRDKCGQGLT